MSDKSFSPRLIQEKTCEWQEHDFYKRSIVLGIDIGLGGIGIYLRRGLQEVYAKTLDFDLPQAEALAIRRQKRAARHCRKNRATRLSRLKALFAKHGLPWLSEERMSRANPFRERLRAVTKAVASPEALSICIRHCVTHRGFDYGGTEEGRFPWGESPAYSEANSWLLTACLTPEMAKHLESLTPELEGKKNAKEQEEKFRALILERLAWSQENDICHVLEQHSKGGHDNLRTRARGFNFPREKVWEHLETLVRRHTHFVTDVDGFIGTLGLKPNRQPDSKAEHRAKKSAIFFYNRKTRTDMERHWEKKVKVCPYAERLGLAKTPCDLNGDLDVRKWNVLDFASSRRVEVEITSGTGKTKSKSVVLHGLSAATLEKFVQFVERHHLAVAKADKTAEPKWEEAFQLVEKDISGVLGESAKSSPQTKSDWNKTFFTQLKDLLVPRAANRNKRASLSAAAAAGLLKMATSEGTDYSPVQISARLKAAGFYDWRRETSSDFNSYPQVECLMGRRGKQGKNPGKPTQSQQGLLHRIFQEHKEELDGAEAPDYCVVEVIGDPPRNREQKKEREREMEDRRDKRQKLFADYDLDDAGIASKRRRIQLYHQQHGRCPYTGAALPKSPLDLDLELEHVFPEEMGGLSVDENLVLTWRQVNEAKKKRPPFQTAKLGITVKIGKEEIRLLSWEAMAKNVTDMRWSAKKREIFAWGTKKEHFDDGGTLLKVPDFGNTTRVAQLARQLRAEVARWMNVDKDPDEAARRIGTPSGWLAAQARKTWLESADYSKIRSNLVHHLIDAAVLSYIPPREGMNHVTCGGIFFTDWETVRSKDNRSSFRLLTKALPGLSPAPHLRPWLSDRAEYAKCPVLKLRSQSKTQSLGDDTFWRQADLNETELAQRSPVDIKKIGSAEELLTIFRDMGLDNKYGNTKTESQLPSREQAARWLDAKTDFSEGRSKKDPGPLCLKDGTPIKSIWKFCTKRNLGCPLGLTAKRNEEGQLKEIRVLGTAYDRVELWLGYDHQMAQRSRKKKFPDWEKDGWTYQKRLIPDACALKHLKQMGYSFGRDKRKLAPDFMQDGKQKRQTVREIVLGGKLLPHSVRVGKIRKGDLALLALNREGEIIADGAEAYWSNWYRVTATADVVEMKSAVLKPGGEFVMPGGLKETVLTRKAGSPKLMALVAGLPFRAAEQAARLGLKIPKAPAQAASSEVTLL